MKILLLYRESFDRRINNESKIISGGGEMFCKSIYENFDDVTVRHIPFAADNDWVGNCHYRKLWLNNLYDKKQKFSYKSLYSNLLSPSNPILFNCDVIQVQPIFLKKETVFQQFENVHKKNVLENCVN